LFLVTQGIGDLNEETFEVSDDDILEFIYFLGDGEAIQIRRADYLDAQSEEDVRFERPKLTLIRGGKR
jgi:hypothetical protein